jgi:hypothetical protein
MLVRHDLALQLGRRVMAGVAAEPILHRELDLGVRQHAFLAGALDLAGREGVSHDHRVFRHSS